MSRFSPGRVGDWVLFCDICGQKCYASESSKLSTYTGRGGLIVCKNDVDKVDYGLVPYNTSPEKNVPWTRINHTATENSSPVFDYEADTVENISSYQYLETGAGDVLVLSQDADVYLATSQEI